jgi:hypothetical protein
MTEQRDRKGLSNQRETGLLSLSLSQARYSLTVGSASVIFYTKSNFLCALSMPSVLGSGARAWTVHY